MQPEQTMESHYLDRLAADLNLDSLPEQEQVKALEMISERLNKVIVATALKVMTPQQKARFESALESRETMENTIAEIAAEVPGLGELLEEVLEKEYEIIKEAMNG